MHWLIGKSAAVNQATWIGFVVRVIFDNFATKNAEVDFIERKVVGMRLLIRVVGDTNPTTAYGIANGFDVHWNPLAYALTNAP